MMKLLVHIFVSILLIMPSICSSQVNGNYLFLYGRIQDCGDKVHVIDYAQVSDSGKAGFLSGIMIDVTDKTLSQVSTSVSAEIGRITGSTPESIRAVEIDRHDTQKVISSLRLLSARKPSPETCRFNEKYRKLFNIRKPSEETPEKPFYDVQQPLYNFRIAVIKNCRTGARERLPDPVLS